MLTYILLWVLVLIVGTIVCFKILHSIAKTAAIAGFILLLFLAITATLTYSDIQELRGELAEKETAILLHEDLQLTFSTVQMGWSDEKTYTASEMTEEELQEWLKKEELNHIRSEGSYYKVFAVETSIFSPVDGSNMLLETIEDKSKAYEDRTAAYNTLQKMLMEKEGTTYLVQQYREGNIIVYPETMAFRIIEILPESWVKKW
jgi:hypothetical protein